MTYVVFYGNLSRLPMANGEYMQPEAEIRLALRYAAENALFCSGQRYEDSVSMAAAISMLVSCLSWVLDNTDPLAKGFGKLHKQLTVIDQKGA